MARVSLSEDVLGDDEPPRRRAPAPAPPAVELEEKPKPRKYTILVDAEDDDRARRVTDDVVRLAGIRPTKQMRADVVRALFAAADDDPELRAVVAARLRDSMTS